MRFNNRIVNFGDTPLTAHLSDDQLMESYVLAGDNRHLAVCRPCKARFDELVRTLPPQRAAAIVHGDYRLDNTIVADDGNIVAVLDWEICTLGDPLADVGLLLVYWGEEGDSLLPLFEPATMAPGFPSRTDVRERYAERSGRDLAEIDFFVALGYWKLAIILEGVYARYAGGQYGKTDEGFEEFARIVERLAQAADQAADRLK